MTRTKLFPIPIHLSLRHSGRDICTLALFLFGGSYSASLEYRLPWQGAIVEEVVVRPMAAYVLGFRDGHVHGLIFDALGNIS